MEDCDVNDFLGIGNPTGRGASLVFEETTRNLDSVKEMAKLLKRGDRFSCGDCRKIGDAIIALEQPPDVCLVHIDRAFNRFCQFIGREHKHMKSATAIDKETSAPL